jgi:hypothetical protein
MYVDGTRSQKHGIEAEDKIPRASNKAKYKGLWARIQICDTSKTQIDQIKTPNTKSQTLIVPT